MPELPEVETVRSILAREVTGRHITGVSFRDFLGVIGAMAPDEFDSLVTGRALLPPERRGKYLVLPLDDGNALVVHLRMTGRLLVTGSETPPVRFEHLAIHLDDGNDMRFADQRKFGRVLHLPLDEAREALSTSLGPEPLGREFTAAYLQRRLRGRTAPIKSFLLDQRHIAGLGNIYVDEALFRSRIHPLTPAGSITESQAASLVRSIRGVLRTSIENQGTTFSSFENPYGERGSNARCTPFCGTLGFCAAVERDGRDLRPIPIRPAEPAAPGFSAPGEAAGFCAPAGSRNVLPRPAPRRRDRDGRPRCARAATPHR